MLLPLLLNLGMFDPYEDIPAGSLSVDVVRSRPGLTIDDARVPRLTIDGWDTDLVEELTIDRIEVR